MNLLFYLLCVGILLYLSVYYASAVLIFLLLCLVLLPAGLWVLAGFSAARSRGALWTATPVWAQEDQVPLRVSLRTGRKGRLPLPRLRYRVDITCSLTSAKERVALHVQKDESLLPWEPDGCGIYRLQLRRAWGRDYLRLFPLAAPCEKRSLELTVLPAVYPCRVTVPEAVRRSSPSGQEYHTDIKGDDLTEPFALRPYTPGDKLNRIHWKLSLKHDTLLVKEGSAPAGCALVLLADMHWQGQDLMDGVFSLSLSLTDALCPHYLCWYDGARLRRVLILDREALYALATPLMAAKKLAEALPNEALYEQAFPGEPAALFLKAGNGLWLGEKQLLAAGDFPESLAVLRLDL